MILVRKEWLSSSLFYFFNLKKYIFVSVGETMCQHQDEYVEKYVHFMALGYFKNFSAPLQFLIQKFFALKIEINSKYLIPSLFLFSPWYKL